MRIASFSMLLLSLAIVARADTLDDAEAKKRGITVAQIQMERLQKANDDLKAENSKLLQENKDLAANVTFLTQASAKLLSAPATPPPAKEVVTVFIPTFLPISANIGETVVMEYGAIEKSFQKALQKTNIGNDNRADKLAAAKEKGKVFVGMTYDELKDVATLADRKLIVSSESSEGTDYILQIGGIQTVQSKTGKGSTTRHSNMLYGYDVLIVDGKVSKWRAIGKVPDDQ